MAILIVLAVAVVFFFMLKNTNRRIEQIERRLNEGSTPTTMPAQNTEAKPQIVNASPLAQSNTTINTKSVEIKKLYIPPQPNPLLQWLKEDWLLKFGVLILIIGFVWFLSYAFAEGWIGETGRVTLGIIAGVIAMIVAEWRTRSHPKQGGAFFILGSGFLFLSFFAGNQMYHFPMFTPVITLGMMFIVSLYVALVSVRFNMKALAVVSLLMSLVSPVLIGITIPSHDLLVPIYLLLVVLSSVWVTSVKSWRELPFISIVGVFLYGLPYALTSFAYASEYLIFVYIFCAIFFVTNIFGFLKNKTGKIAPDIITSVLNTALLLIWIMVGVKEEWKSLILVLSAVIFAIASFAVFKITNRKSPFLVYAVSSLTLIAVATAVQLEGPALLVAYIFEIALLSICTFLVTKNRKMGEVIGAMLIVPGIFVFDGMFSGNWLKGIDHEDFYVGLLFTAVTLLLGAFFYVVSGSETDPATKNQKTYGALFVIGSISFYALLWQSLHSGNANQDSATMISLVIYTVIGLVTDITGKIKGSLALRIYGGTLIGLVIARLLLIDIGTMQITERIVTFFAIGILLISTAFIGRHKKTIQ